MEIQHKASFLPVAAIAAAVAVCSLSLLSGCEKFAEWEKQRAAEEEAQAEQEKREIAAAVAAQEKQMAEMLGSPLFFYEVYYKRVVVSSWCNKCQQQENNYRRDYWAYCAYPGIDGQLQLARLDFDGRYGEVSFEFSQPLIKAVTNEEWFNRFGREYYPALQNYYTRNAPEMIAPVDRAAIEAGVIPSVQTAAMRAQKIGQNNR